MSRQLNKQTNNFEFGARSKAEPSAGGGDGSKGKSGELVDFCLGTVLELELIV